MTKRVLQFLDCDGNVLQEINITKAVRMKSDSARLYLEPVDGGHRLLWSTEIVDEFKDVDMIKVIREDSDSE